MTPARHLPQFSADLEDLLGRFEESWKTSGPPDLAAFRPAAPRGDFLLELSLIDLERRLRGGHPVALALYLDAFPELRTPELSQQLAAAEHDLRLRFVTANGRPSTDPTQAATLPDNTRRAPPPEMVTIASSCEQLQPHAVGGLGEVLVGDDPTLHRRVALKLLQQRWADDARAVRDFLVEAEVTSRLDHPGIVPVHGVGRAPDGRPCYSMRFIEGRTLREAIRDYHAGRPADAVARALVFRDLLTRFVAVCNTVAYAHSRGVLHRDLKPENVMLGRFGETLVLDWGMSRAVDGEGAAERIRPRAAEGSEATAAGEVRGTLAYLSPEQAEGRHSETGIATDVFGLGATLYAILTDAPPYCDSTTERMLACARAAEFEPPRKRRRDVSAALDAVCRKAMARDPAARYGSASELARDVENFLAGERVTAWREPWPVSLQRSLRRRKTLVAVLAALAVVVPLMTAVASWFVARAQAQADLEHRTAEVKAQSAAQITNYLKGLFQSADPTGLNDGAGFRDPLHPADEDMVRRILDRGAELVREHLHDQPDERAALLDAMGNSYRSLGRFDRGEPLIREGYEVRLALYGPDHPDVLSSLLSLGRSAQDRADYAVAEKLFRDVIDGRVKVLGEDHLQTAEARFYLAWVLYHRPLSGPVFESEPLREAEGLLMKALVVQQRELPPDHRSIALTLIFLASVRSCLPGHEAQAFLDGARALEMLRSRDSTSLAGKLGTIYLAAEMSRKVGRFAEAEEGYLRVLEESRRYLGPNHPLVVIQLGNLAGLRRKAGDMVGAEKAIREAIAVGRTLPFRSAPIAVDAIIQLADLVRTRDPAEAKAFYEEALRYAKERPAENTRNIATVEQRLAELR